MTLDELITDLESKPHVASTGTPVVTKDAQGTPTQDPTGMYLWTIPMLEVRGGRVCNVRQVHVKADHSEQASVTVAYYQGSEPAPHSQLSEFRKWLLAQYTGTPGDYRGVLLHHVDEITETAIISRLEGTTTLARVFYFSKKGQQLVEISDGTAELAALEYNLPVDGGRE